MALLAAVMRVRLRGLLGLMIIAGLSGRALSAELGAMPRAEIEALQQRLADAGCYVGPIDGQASAATAAAVKACPDQDPVLRIETGMHTATVTRIGIDTACSLLAVEQPVFEALGRWRHRSRYRPDRHVQDVHVGFYPVFSEEEHSPQQPDCADN